MSRFTLTYEQVAFRDAVSDTHPIPPLEDIEQCISAYYGIPAVLGPYILAWQLRKKLDEAQEEIATLKAEAAGQVAL